MTPLTRIYPVLVKRDSGSTDHIVDGCDNVCFRVDACGNGRVVCQWYHIGFINGEACEYCVKGEC